MTETEAEEWARRIWGAVEYGGRGAREVQALLDEVGSGAVPVDEDRPFDPEHPGIRSLVQRFGHPDPGPMPGAVPPQDIDRDRAREWMRRLIKGLNASVTEAALDRLMDHLAHFVRPVEGVTLTPEETTLAIHALRDPYALSFSDEDLDRMLALAARLEAAS